MQNRRLQNLKEKTLSYKFNVVHVPGKRNLGPDAASRYPTGAPDRLVLHGEPTDTDSDLGTTTTDLRAMLLAGIMTEDTESTSNEESGMIIAAGNMLATLESSTKQKHVVTWDDVQDASATDAEIQELLHHVRTGFSTDAWKLSDNMRPYFPYSSSIYELNGVAMLGERIIVPNTLRPAILDLLHAAH